MDSISLYLTKHPPAEPLPLPDALFWFLGVYVVIGIGIVWWTLRHSRKN
jgi:hypothetical protein